MALKKIAQNTKDYKCGQWRTFKEIEVKDLE